MASLLSLDKNAYFKDIVLEKLKVSINQQLERLDLGGVGFKLDSYLDMISNQMVVRLNAYIIGEKGKKEIKLPSSWWQMFKMEYLPKWFLKRYPIRYNFKGLAEYEVMYPHLKVSLADERHYIHYRKFEPWKVDPKVKKNYQKLLV